MVSGGRTWQEFCRDLDPCWFEYRVVTMMLPVDLRMCVCMNGHHIYSGKGKDQPGKVANLARGQLNREINISLSPFAPENSVSRDGFGRTVPRRPAHLHTQAESGAYSRDFSQFPRRCPFIYLNRHTPSGQSRVYRVTQLRTDGVHCRESAGTGPLNLKLLVVPNKCCQVSSVATTIPSMCVSTSTISIEK